MSRGHDLSLETKWHECEGLVIEMVCSVSSSGVLSILLSTCALW